MQFTLQRVLFIHSWCSVEQQMPNPKSTWEPKTARSWSQTQVSCLGCAVFVVMECKSSSKVPLKDQFLRCNICPSFLLLNHCAQHLRNRLWHLFLQNTVSKCYHIHPNHHLPTWKKENQLFVIIRNSEDYQLLTIILHHLRGDPPWKELHHKPKEKVISNQTWEKKSHYFHWK